MKYLKYKEGIYFEVEATNDSLADLQGLVEGYIERLSVLDHIEVDVWCNEEGKLDNLDPSGVIVHNGEIVDILVGPLGFAKTDEEGYTYPLPANEVCALQSFIPQVEIEGNKLLVFQI